MQYIWLAVPFSTFLVTFGIFKYIQKLTEPIGNKPFRIILKCLMAIVNAVVLMVYVNCFAGSTPNWIIGTICTLAVVIGLENTLICRAPGRVHFLLSSAILCNYMSAYFVIYSVFRLFPLDFLPVTKKEYQILSYVAGTLLCLLILLGLNQKRFPNRELKTMLHSMSYGLILYIWLPLSSLLLIIFGACTLPLMQSDDLLRSAEVAYFCIFLAWSSSSLLSSYIIIFVQCIRVRANEAFEEKNSFGERFLETVYQDYMLRYTVNLTKGEIVRGRDLFRTYRKGTYPHILANFVRDCVHPDDAPAFMRSLSRPEYYEEKLKSSPKFDVELRLNTAKLLRFFILPDAVIQKIEAENEEWIWTLFQVILSRDSDGDIWIHVAVKDINADVSQRKELQKSAERHPLTGLLNRRGWKSRMENHLQSGSAGALILIDLDHFKDVNDNLGHLEGDHILTETSEILASTFRDNDIIGHIGGDEFCIFAVGLTDINIIGRRMETLLQRRRKTYPGKDGKQKKLSFSIGVAIIPAGCQEPYENLIALTDEALYQAKESGRDCWRLSSPIGGKGS